MARRARKPTPRGPTPAGEVRPGAVSRILDELARTEAPDLDQAWAASLSPGDLVGRFEIVREIGRGGFGVVYEARDRQLSRTVAFKALKPGKARLKLAAEWMRQEAEAAAQLNHPNIVTLHDVGSFRGHPFLILELLHGETLDARLARGPLAPAEALDVALQVARALSHAHAAGVQHRDLKPSNVFLCRDGTAKVLDFGLARLLGSTSPSGGTPGYLAPERWRHEAEDARADVFAAGVMLYECLSGQRPWSAEDGGDLLSAAPSPRLEARGVPARVARAVARAIAKDPAERPRDGHEWLLALEGARAAGRRRRGLALAGALAAALAVASAGAFWLVRRGPSPTAGEDRTGPVTVAVADVENATGEKDLDGLSGLLITSLEQSRKLSVLTRSRMLDLLQRPGQERSEHVDERMGREVSRRAGARALLLASIRRFDQVYALELKAIDPIADEYLFTVKEQGTGKASIPGLIDRVGEAARRALREQAAEVSASRVQVADLTSSLEAYQHYFLGVQCIDGIVVIADCVEHFQRALKLDPEFALAHYMLAYTGEFRQATQAEQRAAIDAAIRHIGRAPPKERGLILAWKAHLDGKDDEASGIYRGLVERYPQDAHVAYTAGDLLFHKEDAAGALPLFERAEALGASFPVLRLHIVEALGHLRRGEEALRRARAWAAEKPDADGQQMLAKALIAQGEYEAAVEAAGRAVELGGGQHAQFTAVEALALAGRLSEAEGQARRLAAPDQPAAIRQAARVHLASLLAYQGRRREGLVLLDAFRADGEGPAKGGAYRALWLLGGGRAQLLAARREAERFSGPRAAKHATIVAVALAMHGEGAAAEEVARRHGVQDEELVRIALGWRAGDRAGALARLRALEAKEADPGHLYLLGELHAEEGSDREAVEELRRFRSRPLDGPVRAWAYPRSLFLVARSLERLGDRAGARAEIEKLLDLWRRADADQPLLAEARALRARLGDG